MQNILILTRDDLIPASKDKEFRQITLDDLADLGIMRLSHNRLIDLVIYCDEVNHPDVPPTCYCQPQLERKSKILKSRYTSTHVNPETVLRAYYHWYLDGVSPQQWLLENGYINPDQFKGDVSTDGDVDLVKHPY